MTLDDLITIPRLREALGGVGDSEDVTLSSLRLAAVERIEEFTGRGIIDTRHRTNAGDFLGVDRSEDCFAFRVSDAKSTGDIVFQYAADEDGLDHYRSRSLTISASSVENVVIESDMVLLFDISSRLAEAVSTRKIAPVLTLDVGMPAASKPAVFEQAVAILVRMIYEGSGFDAVPKNNTFSLLLRAHRRRLER